MWCESRAPAPPGLRASHALAHLLVGGRIRRVVHGTRCGRKRGQRESILILACSRTATPRSFPPFKSVMFRGFFLWHTHCVRRMEAMNRNFAWLITLLLLACIHLAEAQQPEKVHRIGLLMSASSSVTTPLIDALRHALRELGYVEGRNIAIERRFAEGQADKLSDLATELVRLKVDIIVATGGNPAIRAAKQATSTIPIVMVIGSDPVESGLVASLPRPGGNITELASIATELIGKRLELLLEVVPGVKRVAILMGSADVTAKDEYKKMEAAARAVGVKLQILKARDSNAIESAFLAVAKERADALVVLPSPRFNQHRELILKHAAKNRLPSIYPHNEFVNNGGLMSYGASYADLFRRASIYLDKILKGAKPSDLPVEQPTKFELVINLKTAKQLGLTIPPNVLARADKVIR
jgi:putative tryptophan/tyrosine transport system substrate-binding protein